MTTVLIMSLHTQFHIPSCSGAFVISAIAKITIFNGRYVLFTLYKKALKITEYQYEGGLPTRPPRSITNPWSFRCATPTQLQTGETRPVYVYE
jgi:hypothetical protein